MFAYLRSTWLEVAAVRRPVRRPPPPTPSSLDSQLVRSRHGTKGSGAAGSDGEWPRVDLNDVETLVAMASTLAAMASASILLQTHLLDRARPGGNRTRDRDRVGFSARLGPVPWKSYEANEDDGNHLAIR